MAEKIKAKKDKGEVQVPVEWDADTDVVKYANHLVVQIAPSEAHLSFFEIKPPLPTRTTGDGSKIPVDAMPIEIKAKCVARIIISPARFGDFVKTLSSSLEKAIAGNESNQPAK